MSIFSLNNSYSKKWKQIAVSSDGAIIVAIGSEGFIYKSSDSGNSWAPIIQAGTQMWTKIAISTDGLIIVAGTVSSNLFISTDGGTTWNQKIINYNGSNSFTKYIIDLAISNTNELFVSAPSSGNAHASDIPNMSTSLLFRSDDLGNTWTRIFPGIYVSNFAISNNGSIILGGGHISKDKGVSSSPLDFLPIIASGVSYAIESGASIVLAVAYGGSIWISTDGGELFVPSSTFPGYLVSNITIKGSRILVSGPVSSNNIASLYLSSNFGATWTSTLSFISIDTTTSLDIGTNIFIGLAIDNNIHKIYRSVNGSSWTLIQSIPVSTNFENISISENGRYIVFNTSDTIYISQDFGQSWALKNLNTTNSTSFNIVDVSINATGSTILALTASAIPVSKFSVSISTDYGASWTHRIIDEYPTSASEKIYNSSISDDGYTMYISTVPRQTRAIPATYIGGIYKSSNRGLSWNRISSYNGTEYIGAAHSLVTGPIITSSNGLKIIIFGHSSSLFGVLLYSSDGGSSWSKGTASNPNDLSIAIMSQNIGSSGNDRNITMSNDGNICYAADKNTIYKTVNGGLTWSKKFTFSLSARFEITSISTNSTGSLLLVTCKDPITGSTLQGSKLYLSNDGGTTFREITWQSSTIYADMPGIQWSNAAISHIGSKAIAYDIHGNIYKNISCSS